MSSVPKEMVNVILNEEIANFFMKKYFLERFPRASKKRSTEKMLSELGILIGVRNRIPGAEKLYDIKIGLLHPGMNIYATIPKENSAKIGVIRGNISPLLKYIGKSVSLTAYVSDMGDHLGIMPHLDYVKCSEGKSKVYA